MHGVFAIKNPTKWIFRKGSKMYSTQRRDFHLSCTVDFLGRTSALMIPKKPRTVESICSAHGMAKLVKWGQPIHYARKAECFETRALRKKLNNI